MVYTLKGISYSDFIGKLEESIIDIQRQCLSNDEFSFKNLADNQIIRVEELIAQHLWPDPTIILDLLQNYYDTDFDDILGKKEVIHNLTDEKDRLVNFLDSLKKTVSYLSIADSLRDIDNTTRIESISDKSDFILNKLNNLFGDDVFSISKILDLNNIKYRNGETQEIAEDLQKRKFVILERQYSFNDKDDYVKISVKGANYIERKNKMKKPVKNEDLNRRLDEVIEHLIKLGYGQEIIFNEIDELRELQYKLSKKSWSQLLQGKLVDLALTKAISKDTANYVYDYLVNASTHLIK